MLKRLPLLLLQLCYFLFATPAPAQVPLCVTAKKLNFRTNPHAFSGRVIAQLPKGAEVTGYYVLNELWVLAEYQGFLGYLPALYLSDDCAETEAQARLTPVFDLQPPVSQTVVLCGGKYAYAYHSSIHCRGLSNCRGGVYKDSLVRAKERGRRACEICY